MNIKKLIQSDMNSAMKAKQTERLSTIRLLMAAIKQKEIDEQIELDHAAVLSVIDKMIKQRQDSIAHYLNAQRQELADKEQFEINVLTGYKPPAFSEIEIDALVVETLNEVAATSIKDMGKVMAVLKPKIVGRADMNQVSQRIKGHLEKTEDRGQKTDAR